MGTNYYLHEKPPCKCCGRPFEKLHIGKSSGGWCFSLHVIPEENLLTLDDWRRRWSAPFATVMNEYGDQVTPAELERIITERVWRGSQPMHHPIDYRHCVGHGPGTWDYIIGEFS